MKTVLILIATVMLALVGCNSERAQAPLSSQNPDGAYPDAETELSTLYDQIQRCDEQGIDVPEAVYDRYFELEELVHPEIYAGHIENSGTIDELNNTCPGTVIQLPEEGDYMYTTCGQTYNATNNCTYPDCRYGRDVIVQIEVEAFGLIRMTTTGSRFDTYLCLYTVDCCGQEDSEKLAENNNNPGLCGGQLLAAGIEGCILPGTYWLVLDGAGPAARGSYCLTIEFFEDECEF